jgi:hypothetical protein
MIKIVGKVSDTYDAFEFALHDDQTDQYGVCMIDGKLLRDGMMSRVTLLQAVTHELAGVLRLLGKKSDG